MIESGLIARTNHEKYLITTYGMLVYHELLSLENIVDHQAKIQAVDSIRMAISDNLNGGSQLVKILGTLIDDHEVRELLVKFYGIERLYDLRAPHTNQQQI